MELVIALGVLLIAVVIYEYRFRKPDQIVVYETPEGVGVRRARLYPRHFSLPISKGSHSYAQTIDASARGNLEIRLSLAVTVAAAPGHLATLVKTGGWTGNAVARAAKELETHLLAHTKEYTERHEIEELTSDGIREHLQLRLKDVGQTLGLEIVSLTITSFDTVNPQIAEAMRQREHARILEQTENSNQQARVAAAKARLRADEAIARLEHEVELQRYDLKHKQLEKESKLAETRVSNELLLKRKLLEFEKEEMRLLKDSPELLLLTPQAARLAEASQSLKNARTVVSLSPGEQSQGNELMGMFQTFVQGAINAYKKRKQS